MCFSHYYFSIADSDVGYVHSLSPIKKARSGKLYYNFDLQTSPTKFTRVVGFDKNSHAQALHYQVTKSPAKIVNINEKEDTIFVNQTSSIVQASSSDVNFLCTAPSTKQGEAKETISSATDITLNEIQTLTRNQKVNVQGHLTLGQNPSKEVIKRNGEKGYVKEDCVIEDRTGSATIQLYFTLLHFTLLFIQLDNSLTQVESGNTYSFQNLSVKNYSGMTLLGTTPTTTFQKVDLQLTEVKGPQLLSNTEKEIVIKEFKFVDKVNVFMTCQIKSCKKKMPHAVGSTVLKCTSCGTSQKVKAAENGMSARLCAEIDGKDCWLTALTDVIEILLSRISLTRDSNTDQTAERLLQIENIKMKINTQSNHIIELLENTK